MHNLRGERMVGDDRLNDDLVLEDGFEMHGHFSGDFSVTIVNGRIVAEVSGQVRTPGDSGPEDFSHRIVIPLEALKFSEN